MNDPDICELRLRRRASAAAVFSSGLPRGLVLGALLVFCGRAAALTFNFDLGGETIEAVSNTTFIAGVAIRTEHRNKDLIAKGDLNPDVCGRGPGGTLFYQDCQGLFREQTFMAAHLAKAPGYASGNFDQGDLNYGRGDIVQAPFRLLQDLNLKWGDFGVFIRGQAYYDPVNYDFTENHPNIITRSNYLQVGNVSTPGTELIRAGANLSVLAPQISRLNLPPNIVTQLLANPTAIPTIGVRNDSQPCPPSRNPSGGPCGIVYGKGGHVHSRRSDYETRREIGLGFLLQDFNLYGKVGLPWDEDLIFKLGRQQVNWGEATIEFFDSLNIANPPNLNNLFRVGGNGLDDFYTGINMLSLSTHVFEGATISGFYQFEWQPIQTPAPGGFDSPVNVGTKNAGNQYAALGFGQLADDPDLIGRLLDNPLSGITNTSGAARRLRDKQPSAFHQFGVQFKYYADWLNNGTDFGVYFANYHSRTPFLSVFSVDQACGKNVGNAAELAVACPNLPIFHGITHPNDPNGATDSQVPFDTLKFRLEYPTNIKLYGLSFNTTFGDVAFQGEAAFRPRDPLQVSIIDLAFAGFGPTLNNCGRPPGCEGSNVGIGTKPDGSVGTYGSSDFVVDANGTPGGFRDTYDAVIGAIPSSARSFPSFIIPYRGGVIGQNPGDSYIRGWEYFKTLSLDIGGTYLDGETAFFPRLILADQIIYLFEVGARGVFGLPSLDRLQLEAPGLQYHASAGADGSGANRSRQACSTNLACSYGPDGLRFNPHQQDRKLFATDWSGGYSLILLIRYESVLPGISVQPQIIFKHDVVGHSPGLASNYVQGRIIWDTGIEVRYKSNFSFNFGYQFITGGGVANALNDRDAARVFAKYAF